MRRYQRGVTTLGWIILFIPVAIVGYSIIRLTPIYLNYLKVAHSLESVAAEVPNEGQTADGIRNAVDKHFQIDSLDFPDPKDIRITRNNSVWQLEANYDDQVPLFSNLFLLVSFDKIVHLKGTPGGG
jgi:hypothetical protein